MKKLPLILYITVLILSFCACTKPILSTEKRVVQLETGMTYDDVLSVQEGCIPYQNYVFYRNSEGNNVVCKFNEDTQLLDEIMEFSLVEPTMESFSGIRKGMTVADVVKTVGLPIRSATFGLATLDFNCTDGTVYRISWDIDMKVIEVKKVP